MKRVSSLAIAFAGLFSVSTWASTPDFPHVSTTGYGEVVAKPDMAKFAVRVTETTMTADQAKQTVDKIVTDFLAELSEQGMNSDNVTSSNLYIAPQYHYPKDGKPELVGYRATRTVNVTVFELANLNQYLDIALNSGINQVENVQLQVKEQAKYQDQARLAAIKDASAKAKSLATGFGKKLKDVWQINYSMTNNQPVLMRSMAMDSKTESNSYQDSTIVIRDRVDVIYQLD
ncbi:oxidative stress defense protein [Vibrio ostreicida]|uniref:oxidative stress defense protein n=1 Tax=Vibrio ostreicida TaxID=526588 RepID=UPI000970DDE0|nr:oxidative stress defense protein [Vibrio ostreicida]